MRQKSVSRLSQETLRVLCSSAWKILEGWHHGALVLAADELPDRRGLQGFR